MTAEQISLLALGVAVAGWLLAFLAQLTLRALQDKNRRWRDSINQLALARLRVIISLGEWFKAGLSLAEEAHTLHTRPLSDARDQEVMLLGIQNRMALWRAEMHQYLQDATLFLHPEYYLVLDEDNPRRARKLLADMAAREKDDQAGQLFDLVREYRTGVETYVATEEEAPPEEVQPPDDVRGLYHKAQGMLQQHTRNVGSL